jgi:hypothetical protein
MKTSYKVFAPLVLSLIGIYSCSHGCRHTRDYYADIVNTLLQPVTVEFRPTTDQANPQTITIDPEQSSQTFILRVESKYYTKGGWCDDYNDTEAAAVEFSNATLSQYTICKSIYDSPAYAVLVSGSTCSGDYPVEQTTGW